MVFRLLLLFLLPLSVLNGQKLVRNTLGSLGCSENSNQLFIQQVVGQPSVISSIHVNEINLRQGFLQPEQRKNQQQPKLVYSVYPNPNNGDFKVSIEIPENETVNLTLFDATGKSIFVKSSKGSTIIPISINPSNSGIYTLDVRSSNNRIEEKVVVIH